MDQRNQRRIKIETLTIGIKGLTPPLLTRSAVAAFREEVLWDSHPRLELVGARRLSHHRLCAGRSSSRRAGSRRARAFAGRGIEPPCAHLGVPLLETPGSSSLASVDASMGRRVPTAPTSQECVGRAPPRSHSTAARPPNGERASEGTHGGAVALLLLLAGDRSPRGSQSLRREWKREAKKGKWGLGFGADADQFCSPRFFAWPSDENG
jgi:hypothetical protein